VLSQLCVRVGSTVTGTVGDIVCASEKGGHSRVNSVSVKLLLDTDCADSTKRTRSPVVRKPCHSRLVSQAESRELIDSDVSELYELGLSKASLRGTASVNEVCKSVALASCRKSRQ